MNTTLFLVPQRIGIGSARGRGLVRNTLQRRLFSFRKQVNQYFVLQVEQGASLAEIKIAYFKLAKQVHPDVVEQEEQRFEHGSKNTTQFLRLVEAYETLKCPKKRRLHDEQLSTAYRVAEKRFSRQDPKSNTATESETETESESESESETDFAEEFPDVKISNKNVRLYMPYKAGYDLNNFSLLQLRKGKSWLKELEKEFQYSIEKVFHGPQVPCMEDIGLKHMLFFPWAFEAEVRTNEAHEDILQIVSGRQLLGMVRLSETIDKQIEMNNKRAEIEHTLRESYFETHRTVDLWYFGELVGRAVKIYSKRRSCYHVLFFLVENEDRHKSETPKLIFTGKVICEDQRTYDEIYPEFGVLKKFPFISQEEIPTHTLLQYRTFGVSYQDWYRNESLSATRLSKTLDVNVALCEVRVKKAWYPDRQKLSDMCVNPFGSQESIFWKPRSNSHSGASWYFEIARPKEKSGHVPNQEQKALPQENPAPGSDDKSSVSQLPKDVIDSWHREATLATKRLQNGGIDPRIPVLFTALCS